jgi:nucleotide-binding universal stress UspA family protein
MNGSAQSVVVVGIDGSEQALVAARWAAGEAARRKLPLRLLHAFTVPIMGVPAYGVPPDLSEGLRVAGHAALEAALREINAIHPDLQVSADLVNADPRPALVEASAEASLTVVGTRGGGRIPEVVLGSVALHVASHGRSPVAVISQKAGEPTTGAVVLGVDGSGTSEAAIAYAFEEADRRRATLDAVLVWDDLALRGYGGTAEIGQLEDEEEHAVLGEQLAGWRDKYPDVQVRQVILRGRPADALLQFGAQLLAGPQLVVVGSRGRGGLSGLLLGSTSQSLICHAQWPVVVVRKKLSP